MLLCLLLLAEIEQEGLFFLTDLLRKLAKGGLLQAERTKRGALLNAELAVLSAEGPEPLTELTGRLGPRNTELATGLRALCRELRLRLPELSRLRGELTCELLCRDAKGRGPVRNVRLSGRPGQAELASLSGQLPSKLRCRKTRLRLQLFEVDARLSKSLRIRGSKLVRAQSELAGLHDALLPKLLRR